MKNRGQFYLLSAIVIIAIIIGFSTVSTYTRKGEVVRIFDLGEELEIESSNVLDYGTYPANLVDIESEGGLNDFLKEFVSDYADYIGEDKEISFVFGNPDDGTVTVVSYEEFEAGTISDISSTTLNIRKKNETEEKVQDVGGKKRANVEFKDRIYDINLRFGENFYFVISQTIGEEIHIASSEGVEGRPIDEEEPECVLDSDCSDNEVCESEVCVEKTPTEVCGNNVKETGEECDEGTENTDTACIALYGETCTYCDTSCNLQTVTGSSCGDGNIDSGEQCDNGANNGEVCSASYGGSCNYCDASCKSQTIAGGSCGDGIKNGPEKCDDGNDNGKKVDSSDLKCSVTNRKPSKNYCRNDCKIETCKKEWEWWPPGCQPMECS